MKKTLLLSLALGMGLCANADVVRTQVTSVDELVAGQTYQLACYNKGWTDGPNKWLTAGTTPTHSSDADAATIWTFETADPSLVKCTAHTSNFCLKTGDQYLVIGNNATPSMASTPDVSCVFHFFASSLDNANANKVVIGGEDTNIFGFHFWNTGKNAMATTGSNASGGFGAFSDNATGIQMFYNALDVQWSTYYVIYKVEITDPRDAYKAQYTTAKTALENSLIGEGLNKYSFSNGTTVSEWNGYGAELEAAWTAETFDAEAFEAVVAKINAAAGALTLNMPEAGSFLRIKMSAGAVTAAGSTGDWYIGTDRAIFDVLSQGNRYLTRLTQTPDITTVFYYDGNSLLNMATGTYLYARTYNHAHVGSGLIEDGELDNYECTVSFLVGYPKEQGVYAIALAAVDGDHRGRYIHNHILQTQSTGDPLGTMCTNSCGSVESIAHNLNLEYVDELELAVNADGVRTLTLPVDLNVAAGFEGFTMKVEDNVLSLTKVDVIPANTPAMLKGAANAKATFTYTIPEPEIPEEPIESEYVTFKKLNLTAADITCNNVASYDGQGIAGMLDDNEGTFFHSNWQGSNPITDNTYGTYLEVTLPCALSEFGFMVQNRNHLLNNPSGAPKIVHLYGSNDGTAWTKIAEINDMTTTLTSALSKGYWGVDVDGAVTTAPYTDGNAYTKLRFCVMEVGGGAFTTSIADISKIFWACASWELWGANPAYQPAVAATAEGDAATGLTGVYGHRAVAQRTAAEGNVLLVLTESSTAGTAKFAAIEGDVMPAHAVVVEAKEAVSNFTVAAADGAKVDLTTGEAPVDRTIEVTLNSGNATASEAVGTAGLYFKKQTSDTNPAITLTYATSGIQNNTGNNRFILRDGVSGINSFTVSCEKTGYYISAIEINAQDGGYNGDEIDFYMTDGTTKATEHSPANLNWEYDYDEATASMKTIQFNQRASSFTKNLYIYYVKVTMTPVPGTPVVDYTPISEALAAKAAVLATVKESVPGSETSVDEFIGKYAALTPEAIATEAGGVSEGVRMIDSEFTKFMADAQASIPTWMGGKQVTLKNIRRNAYAASVDAGTSSVSYNTVANVDQSAVWSFVYEPEAETCVLYNLYSKTYASPNESGYTKPVANKADAAEVSLEIADNGRLVLYTEGAYGYLCFDNNGYPMAYWRYDEGCDWAAALTDIQVSPVVSLEEINVEAANDEVYDLQGRRVYGTPARGLYIVNGRKVIK